MKIPLPLMGYNLMSCERGPRGPKTIQDIAIVPDYLPDLSGRALLLKTPHILFREHKKIKLRLDASSLLASFQSFMWC